MFPIHDLHLDSASPCIDTAGDAVLSRPAIDLRGVAWADAPGLGSTDTVTDMGAYEYVP